MVKASCKSELFKKIREVLLEKLSQIKNIVSVATHLILMKMVAFLYVSWLFSQTVIEILLQREKVNLREALLHYNHLSNGLTTFFF